MRHSFQSSRLAIGATALVMSAAVTPALADIMPLGSPITVTSSTDVLGDMALARDVAGDFVIVWNDAGNIYAQVFDANGSARTAIILVGSDFVSSVGVQFLKSVAMDDAGNFVLAWVKASGDSTNPVQIVAQRYSVDGALLGSQIQVSGLFKQALHAAVAVNHLSGDFAVTWTDDKFTGYGANAPGNCTSLFCSWSNTTTSYARLYKNDGTPLTGSFTSHATEKQTGWGIRLVSYHFNGTNSGLDSIALDTSDRLVTTFSSNYSHLGTTTYSVTASRFDASGKAIGSNFTVSTNTPGSGSSSQVGVDDSGSFLICWNAPNPSGNPTYTARYASDGSLQGSITAIPIPVLPAGQYVFIDVAMAPSGNYMTAWNLQQDQGTGTALFPQGQYYDPSGNTIGPIFDATDSGAPSFSIGTAMAIDAAGEPVMSWVDYFFNQFGSSTYTLKVQRFSSP